ncbi:MAG: hypothetical protein Q9171_005769 [Xanthocarpia ochracea]
MTSLAAFSLVAGILQVLDVSYRTVKECREIYKDGSAAAHRDTGELAEALAHATERLNASRHHSSTNPSQETLDILNLSRNIASIARELQAEITKLKLDHGGHYQTLSKAVQSMRKAPWLKEMQAKLNSCARTLDTLILIKLDTQSLRRSHDIDSLDQKVRDLALRIERGRITTDRLLAHQTSQILDHIDQRFDEKELQKENDQARERFRDSLFFPDIEAREDEIADAFEGTCRWIFDPPLNETTKARKWHKFGDWLKDGKDNYWVSGKPGSGKSTLMKYIVGEPRTAQYLSEWKQTTHLIVVTFFFKNLGTHLQKSATGLLRSLILQITQQWPEMINLVRRRYSETVLKLLPTWTEKKLLLILEDFLVQKPVTVSLCAFIDGLDEYSGDEDCLFHIIDLLSSTTNSKLCVSSRPDQAFREKFQGAPQCRVQDLNEQDIRKMVAEKLRPCLEKNKPADIEAINELVEQVINKAEGVFLWLNMIIKFLTTASRNGDSIDELEKRLQVTPSTITDMYKHIFTIMDPFYLSYAFRVFQILIAADVLINTEYSRPVSLLALACAEKTPWMYIQRLDRAYFTSPSFNSTCCELYKHLTVRCGNLIEISESEGDTEEASVVRHCRTVSFIHKTVVEFLRQEYESIFNDHACLSTAWVSVARGKMGLLFLIPLTKPFHEPDEYQAGKDGTMTKDDSHDYGLVSQRVPEELEDLGYDLRYLCQSIMLTLSFGEYFAGNEESGSPVDNVLTDMTSHMLQILLYLTKLGDSAKSLLSRAGPTWGYSDAEDPFLCQNGGDFAAFWGWRSYIRSRGCGEVFEEELENVFINALLGLSDFSRNLPSRARLQSAECVPMANLQTVGFLLQSGRFQLDKLSPWRPLRAFGDGICWTSTMGAFFISACQAIAGDHRLEGWHDEEEARIKFGLDLIKQSQLPGSHFNPRLGLTIHFEITSFHVYDVTWDGEFLVDETPLAYLQQRRIDDKVLQSLRDTLQSKGAVERRRFRFWKCNDAYDTYYRINPSQSKKLNNFLCSQRYTCSSLDSIADRMFFTAFDPDELNAIYDNIIALNDQLHPQTSEEEWKHGGSDWLEEYHEFTTGTD